MDVLTWSMLKREEIIEFIGVLYNLYFASDDPSATNEPESDDEDEDEDDDVSKHASIQSLQFTSHTTFGAS